MLTTPRVRPLTHLWFVLWAWAQVRSGFLRLERNSTINAFKLHTYYSYLLYSHSIELYIDLLGATMAAQT